MRGVVLGIIVLIFFGCVRTLDRDFEKEEEEEEIEIVDLSIKYDIILVAGQSNTNSGVGLDFSIDSVDYRIKQLGRDNTRNLKIVEAKEPLDHHGRSGDRIGFALTFSKLYADGYLEAANEEYDIKVLLILCGLGGSGFINNRWNKGDDLYKDAIYRTNLILKTYPRSELKTILWHQGESDIENDSFMVQLDSFIIDLREDLNTEDPPPFILGGMVPFWVSKDSLRGVTQEIIMDTPNRLDKVGYADPMEPFIINKENDFWDMIHYDASGQRELAKRYFSEYERLVAEEN